MLPVCLRAAQDRRFKLEGERKPLATQTWHGAGFKGVNSPAFAGAATLTICLLASVEKATISIDPRVKRLRDQQ